MKTKGHERKEGKTCLGPMKREPNERGQAGERPNLIEKPAPRARKEGRKGRKKREKEEKGRSDGVPSYDPRVQGHTKMRRVPSCDESVKGHPSKKERERERERE